MQARNQLGTIGVAKSFLRRAQIFKLCPMVLTYAQHVSPGGEKNFAGGFWLRAWTYVWRAIHRKAFQAV